MATSPELANAAPATQSGRTRAQWMVLIAAFLGWMFDGLEQGVFPLVARPALLDLLGAALPETAFWLLAEAATQPADRRFEQVLAGPPFDGLRRLTTGEPGDPSAWPLACYRQCATDADVVLPVVGRSGAALASQLETAAEACPAARLRLAPGLTAAQAAELTLAIRRPAPPAWSLPLAGAALPAEPATLRRAGLDTVVVQVGGRGLPPALLSAVAAALAPPGCDLLVRWPRRGSSPGRRGRTPAPLRRLHLPRRGAAASRPPGRRPWGSGGCSTRGAKLAAVCGRSRR